MSNVRPKWMNYRGWLVAGLLAFGVGLSIDQWTEQESFLSILSMIVLFLGAVCMGLAAVLWRKSAPLEVDERFVWYRYKATRFALIMGMLGMLGWFVYQVWVHRVVQWECIALIALIALSKVGAMLYFRHTG